MLVKCFYLSFDLEKWGKRECISRFKDCPLCGADIEKIEEDENLQSLVDRFIDGHARLKRTHVDDNAVDKVKAETNKKVIYEDVSLDRGTFLVQQAMRVSCYLLLILLIFLYCIICSAIFILFFSISLLAYLHYHVCKCSGVMFRHFVPRILEVPNQG